MAWFLIGQLSPISNTNGGPTAQVIIAITNPDLTQTWVTSTVNWALTNTWLQPYQQVQATDIHGPTPPVQLPFTNTGPQSFSFENPIVWTQPQDVQVSLRPFPVNLQQLERAVTGNIAVLVQSRQTGAPYLPGGALLPPNTFTWATMVQLTIKQVPAATGGQALPDVYALSGASQQDQALLEHILRVLETDDPIAAIQVLSQTSAGVAGLSSGPINSVDVSRLRTNPPQYRRHRRARTWCSGLRGWNHPDVAVGAQIDQHVGFLQIIQQAAVTNAPEILPTVHRHHWPQSADGSVQLWSRTTDPADHLRPRRQSEHKRFAGAGASLLQRYRPLRRTSWPTLLCHHDQPGARHAVQRCCCGLGGRLAAAGMTAL